VLAQQRHRLVGIATQRGVQQLLVLAFDAPLGKRPGG
jgi:hypothetical protein